MLLLLPMLTFFLSQEHPRRPLNAEELRQEAKKAKIERLSPMEFGEVPLNIRQQFADMGCTIPQLHRWWTAERPHNIVSGEFAVKGQTDWAALCSIDKKMAIVVLWGGLDRCQSPVEAMRSDSFGLQWMGWENRMGFSVQISQYSAEFDNLSHDGINTYFLDKGGWSVFCKDGEWTRFVTAD